MKRKSCLVYMLLLLFAVANAQSSFDDIPGINSINHITNYFSSTLDFKQVVYAKKEKGEEGKYIFYENYYKDDKWGKEKEIKEINKWIKKNTRLGGTCFNYNGSVLFFSIDLGKGYGLDIYTTTKKNGEWSIPVKYSKAINTRDDESDPSISADGNLFFFSRGVKEENDFSKDFACNAIFISEKNANKTWGKPYRLSLKINAGCEKSPRICADGKTLFFASVRDKKQQFDIYRAKMIAKGIWTIPNKVDTICDERSNIYPTISFEGDRIYYVNQDKVGKKKEEGTLFSSFLPAQFRPEKNKTIKGSVSDLFTKKAIKANINITNPFTSELISEYETNSDGTYWFLLNADKQYRIEFYSQGYSYDIKSYVVGKLKDNETQKRDIELYSEVDVILNIFDRETFEPLNAKLKIIDSETKKEVDTKYKMVYNGRFTMKLPIGKKYYLLASKENYITDTLKFDIKKIVQFNEFEKDMELSVMKRKFTVEVLDKNSSDPIPSAIRFTNNSRKQTIWLPKEKSKDGKQITLLREGDSYEIEAIPGQGFTYNSASIDLQKDKKDHIIIKVLSLKQNTKLELKNIVFETNSAELTTVSYVELNRIADLLKANPQLKVELSAHTDDVGSARYNLKLSERRAASVVTYLIEQGVLKDNLISKGYGETQPLVPNDSDENKAKNRRVELNILEVNL